MAKSPFLDEIIGEIMNENKFSIPLKTFFLLHMISPGVHRAPPPDLLDLRAVKLRELAARPGLYTYLIGSSGAMKLVTEADID